MMLTTHFELSEFLLSDVAARFDIPNTPSDQVITRLLLVAACLEKVREHLKAPILISSGYRSSELNRAVRGSKNSAHMYGWAVDFTCPGFGTPLMVCRAISRMDIEFDQLIHEFGSWCHLSIDPKNRHQLLTIDSNGTREGLL